ncbi:MAG: response regulator [Methanoregula sp.]|uniref:response regulator n=1 Tax=Methanoregula sp. TaxID=2052170 RepID=UPI003D13C34A
MTRKILVVEDDQPILELMDVLIRKLGYEPVLITNGPEALDAIQKEPPSLILLDIMMEPMDGWEFLEKLRGDFAMRDIPVIIFSASPVIEEKMKTIRDPKLGVLTKPISFSELRAGIEHYLT